MTPKVAESPKLEYGACSSSGIEKRKFKWRGVSAVRHFPPRCGPNAPKADVEGNGAVSYNDNVRNTENPSGDCPEVGNMKTMSASENPGSFSGSEKSVHVVLEEGEIDVLKDEQSVDGLVNLPKSLESSDMNGVLLPRIGDSSEALRVNAEFVTKNLLLETQDPDGDCPEVGNRKTLSAPENPGSFSGSDKWVHVVLEEGEIEEGEIEVFKDEHSVDGSVNLPKSLESLNGVLLPRIGDSSEALRVNAEFVTKNLLLETQDPSKDLMSEMLKLPDLFDTSEGFEIKDGNKIFVEEEKVAAEGNLPYHAIPSAAVWKKRDYPPRRRVSVKRDFPTMCGTNVLSSKNCLHLDAPLEGKDMNKDKLEPEVSSSIHDDVILGSKMAETPCGRSMHVVKAQAESDRDGGGETAMQIVQPSKTSDGQYRMSELQSNTCVQSEKLKLTYDRKIEKGTFKGRESKGEIVYRKDKGDKKRKIIFIGDDTHLPEENMGFPYQEEGRVSVQGQVAAVNCQWRQGQESGKATSSFVGAKDSRPEKHTVGNKFKLKIRPSGAVKDSEKRKDESIKKTAPSMQDPGVVPRELLKWGEKNSTENDRRQKQLALVDQSREVDVRLPPLGASARNKVREKLRLFQALIRKLLQEEINPQEQRPRSRRVDLQALNIFKAKGKYIMSEEPILGQFPGVEVGDEFHYRVELMIVGLHRLPQAGINYRKVGGRVLAASIVESGGYDNIIDNSDVWIYTGEGGNTTHGRKEPEDQKLEKGNLALKNSKDIKNPIRVIRGVKHTSSSTTSGRNQISTIYTYYGLYTVERCWIEDGKHGNKEYKFELKRQPGQPALAWKEVNKSKNFREGCCKGDISEGKEKPPICAVNTIDVEKPPLFKYIPRMIYPHWCKPLPPRGCDCKDGCVNSNRCSCVAKNGGEIPYTFDGAIVQSKPLVYECGPSCKCPPTCYNKVSQRGIRFKLEIFKTASRGWGVRSLSSIPSGSFICEYTGKLLQEKEAEQRTGNDEYLFDIGRNYKDHSLWEGLRGLIPDAALISNEAIASAGFTIDAAKEGSVGRFINHSCSPNLYAQDVLYDHGDTRMPHVMFFAAENIPPLQELTYHYNYKIGEVYDKYGNVKVKRCYCGSSNCTGRMY